MKLIFRADDVGYTKISNRGAFKSVDEGPVSLVELMVDCPGSVDAMEFLRERPWVSVNWHVHWWGRPVAGPENVPSMVDENGNFLKSLANSHRGGAHPEIDYEEALRECRAELELCVKVMGRVPDATSLFGEDTLNRAKRQACDEFGVVYGYDSYYHYGPAAKNHEPGPHPNPGLKAEYAPLGIFEYENFGRPGLMLKDYKLYDPLEMIMTIPDEDDKIFVRSQHPGYVDARIWEDTADICSITRCKDTEVLCSARLHAWIRDSHVELMNLRDALYGSREYQNHLAAVGSDLAFVRKEG